MADPAWPFQCPTVWGQKSRTSVIRSEVDAGAPKSRARFTKSYLEIQAQWTFESWDLLAIYENWFLVDLNDGSKAFTIQHPMTGIILRVRFKDTPSISADSAKKPTWSMSAELEQVLT